MIQWSSELRVVVNMRTTWALGTAALVGVWRPAGDRKRHRNVSRISGQWTVDNRALGGSDRIEAGFGGVGTIPGDTARGDTCVTKCVWFGVFHGGVVNGRWDGRPVEGRRRWVVGWVVGIVGWGLMSGEELRTVGIMWVVGGLQWELVTVQWSRRERSSLHLVLGREDMCVDIIRSAAFARVPRCARGPSVRSGVYRLRWRVITLGDLFQVHITSCLGSWVTAPGIRKNENHMTKITFQGGGSGLTVSKSLFRDNSWPKMFTQRGNLFVRFWGPWPNGPRVVAKPGFSKNGTKNQYQKISLQIDDSLSMSQANSWEKKTYDDVYGFWQYKDLLR